MAYLLDSDVFIRVKNDHYGFDFCAAFWDWLEAANATGIVHSVEAVYNELAGSDDDLAQWVKDHGALVVCLSACASEILPADRLDDLPSTYDVQAGDETSCGSGVVQICSRSYEIRHKGSEEVLIDDLRGIGIDVGPSSIDHIVESGNGYARVELAAVNETSRAKVRFLVLLLVVLALAVASIVGASKFKRNRRARQAGVESWIAGKTRQDS